MPSAPSIQVCHLADPDLDQCIIASVNGIRSNIGSGDFGNGTKLIAMDPAFVDRMDIDAGPSLQASFRNCTVTGAKTYQIDKMHFDVPKRMLKVLLTLAEMNLRGKYIMRMKLSMLQLDGAGDFTTNSTDVKVLLKIRYAPVERTDSAGEKRPGVRFLPVDFKVKFAGPVRFYLQNLINGQPELDSIANEALNQNPDLLLEKAIPAIRQFFSERFTAVANGLVQDADLDEVFPV
ncbi:uncharacterized protein LOC129731111 isoform X2 [Wyeomyia smithii]|uniref:uncharacterized protein LOC129731111 isoform X2 n=1 Tax=Wyeomyia smithii TaxID=174621 RepID=UPI002467F206|nr:uncharacterized protein LOC129731111 isoform X2 [Wyeomyia smithii]